MLRGDEEDDGVVVCFGGVTLPPFVPSLDEGCRGFVFWLIMSVNLRVKEDFFGNDERTVMVNVVLCREEDAKLLPLASSYV